MSEAPAWAESIGRELGSGPLFAVVDSARHPAVLEALCRPGSVHWSLYDGRTAELLADVAPYLVDLRKGPERRHALLEGGWGDFRGFYFHSDREPDALRSHLRHFMMVRLEDEEVFFRFYDPRVLRPFLKNIDSIDGAKFIEPFLGLYCEGDSGDTITRFRPLRPHSTKGGA